MKACILLFVIIITLYSCKKTEFIPPEIPEIWDFWYPEKWFDYPLDIDENIKLDYFSILNWAQRGVYLLNLNTDKISWSVYLKAFSIPDERRLSEVDLLTSTYYQIEANQGIVNKEFKIFEWNWGVFYWVRFELWRKDSYKWKDQKIWEKYYIIEWWQR